MAKMKDLDVFHLSARASQGDLLGVEPHHFGILPTTDAVIVLTQLAKDPGADRSVNEISVLQEHLEKE